MMADELDPFYTSTPTVAAPPAADPFYAPKPPPAPAVSKPLTGMEVARQAYKNIGPSAVKAAKELVYPFTHAPETIAGLQTIGAGLASKAAPYVGAGYRSPEGEQALGSIADYYKQRYGSLDAAKRAFAEDPVGTMMDVSTAVTGYGGVARGAGLGASKVARLAGRTGALGEALAEGGHGVAELGRLIDPVSAATSLGAMAAEPITKGVLPEVLALHTGKSAESFRRAEEAGAGKNEEFWRHLWGSGKPEEVIDKTRDALQSIKDQRSQEYTSTSRGWKSSQTPLNLNNVRLTFSDIIGEHTPQGGQIAMRMEEPLDKIKSVIDRYSPTKKTMSDLDLMKKDLDSLYYDSAFRNPDAKAALTRVRQEVWNTISDHDPVYADIMGKYEQATNEINNIISDIGTDRASTATRLRKLVKASDKDTVRRLAEENPNLPYMIAGQELTPMGLGGIRGALASSLYAIPALSTFNPAMIPYAAGIGLAFPRVSGTLQTGAGALRTLPMKMEAASIPQTARRAMITAQKPRFEASVTAAEPKKDEGEDYFYTRTGRASGGRINRGMNAQMLMAAVERAKANGQKNTESILNAPDEHVVQALKVANENI
jgi:hypothetical protein